MSTAAPLTAADVEEGAGSVDEEAAADVDEGSVTDDVDEGAAQPSTLKSVHVVL